MGRAKAADDGTPVDDGVVLVENEEVARTNSKGHFSFELPKGKTRVSVTFKSLANDFVTTTKIFTLSEETSTYHTVYLQRRAPSVTLDGSVDSTIPLGGDEGQANAELFIPAGSFYKEDGTPYTGNVQASLTPTDLTDQSAVDTIQSDLSTRDAEGEQVPLKTFGMFSMQFTDDDGDPLRVDGDMKLFIDAEKANIDTSAASLPHLWFLNQQTGEWEDIGGLEISQERRKKRQWETQEFVVGNINLVGYDLTNLPSCNIDQIERGYRICHLKVRAYTDDSLTEPLEGVTVTAITNDLVVRDRYARDVQSGRFSFFYTATTGPDGSACVLTFCARNDSLFSVNVKAEYEVTTLTAVHPNDVPHDKHPGQWPQDLLQTFTLPQSAGDETGWVTMRGLTPQMAYTLTEYAEKFWYGWDWWNWWDDDYEWYGWDYEWYDYERIESRELGPFYWQWWNYYTAKERCIDANLTENHLVFFSPTKVGSLYEYEFEDYDINSVKDQERNRTVYSWFPFENEDKRTCFIKILVKSESTERFSVSSFSGGHPRVGNNTMYGLRIDDSKPTHLSLEYRQNQRLALSLNAAGICVKVMHSVMTTYQMPT
ncbi:cartilage intermediate layer protein 1-like [Ptychodera flava]|uniref:cartilage intermediate layer protein 1-like n=1 Tax=Ptychodera flava TaxID=63121 RepID=UPI00396A1F74